MKSKRKMPLSVVCSLSYIFFACAGSPVKQPGESIQYPVPVSDDSIYHSDAKLIARNFEYEIEKTSKYREDDSIRIMPSEVGHVRPKYSQTLKEIDAPAGVKYAFTMPNKTKVQLNSCSQIIFHPEVPRYFELKGEAYFEVEEDSTLIDVDNKIEVIAKKGTKINITAYPDSIQRYKMKVAIIKGYAVVTNGKSSRTLKKPGTKAVYDVLDKAIVMGDAEIEDILAWTQNTFSYDDIDHYELLQRICRWYKLELIFPKDQPYDSWVFGGNFKSSPSFLLGSLNAAGDDMEYKIEGRKLIVSKK